ncbi:hypothetical protein FQN60_005690 [Etheostoma spectabile]|uniref:PHTF1/2 N-terminal domain-containing protein n=1 Tax=Etheostoma spectabile TaxID=54343 RepID=A0A5J5CGL8_9PERO|nr:hypothetical protein FQN60_005690 [Etheostoma spectabile]
MLWCGTRKRYQILCWTPALLPLQLSAYTPRLSVLTNLPVSELPVSFSPAYRQCPIGAYDQQIWEKSVEQREIKCFLLTLTSLCPPGWVSPAHLSSLYLHIHPFFFHPSFPPLYSLFLW